jgi:endonuclease/exonuclease/phosphatase family metal-dependent hydrolase
LSVASEILIDTQRFVRGSNGFTTSVNGFLRSVGRNLLKSPVLRSLHPIIRKVKNVAEPAGLLSIRYSPSVEIPSPQENSITIISANLCHGWPNQDDLLGRLTSFANLVEQQKANIILLQEVSRTPELRADEWLSERLGMAYVYSRANGHRSIGFEEGVALFSRYSLKAPRLKEFSNGLNPFVRRVALGAYIDTPFGCMPFFSVHLGITPKGNAAQMGHLREWVSDIAGKRPAFIGGDFNTNEGTPQIRYAQTEWVDTFRHIHPHIETSTHELRWPWGNLIRRSRLDYIFLKPGDQPWQVKGTEHLDSPDGPHSDHRAVITRLEPLAQV